MPQLHLERYFYYKFFPSKSVKNKTKLPNYFHSDLSYYLGFNFLNVVIEI